MYIILENIGIVKKSKISLDGLTVITGKNNSGKTTVGKVVYSLLDSVSNLSAKAKNDKSVYIRKKIMEVLDSLDSFRLPFMIKGNDLDFFAEQYPLLFTLLKEYHFDINDNEIEKTVQGLKRELESLDTTLFSMNGELEQLLKNKRRYFSTKEQSEQEDSSNNIFEVQREKAISILDKMFEDISKDPQLIDYARESINQTLRCEFTGQIQPIRIPVQTSRIVLADEGALYFDINVESDRIVNDGNPVFFSSPYKKTYFIDDPFILDDFSSKRAHLRMFSTSTKTETILNPNRIKPHSSKLKEVLGKKDKLSIFEQTVLDEALRSINDKLNSILPGSFEFDAEEAFYIQNGNKLKIGNLATGSKMFSIIKRLLELGEIDETTFLVLDEPEAHLHPKWQNIFAEIIVLLVKYLNVNILLTTHSSNFMLALDAYMRKYSISDITNFYQTNIVEDGFVEYSCMNDDMGKIYEDFLQYLSEMKMLRKKYLNEIEG